MALCPETMRIIRTLRILLLLYAVGTSAICQSSYFQDIRIKGQLSGWLSPDPTNSFRTFTGIRYIPELSLKKDISEKFSLDTEISVNSYGSAFINSFDSITSNGNIKPYRMWLRLSSKQFELRAGLQKINFGSASFLRPLMWFDRIDPRDPLQLTDGVYALLARYYFQNNTNIWLWGLYGNKSTKGWEMIPSSKNKIEYGGRIQAPLLTGELALTLHHRKADLSGIEIGESLSSNEIISENRIGIDGKWDIGIGLWFESSITHQNLDISPLEYKRAINLGADYTFGLGNGLNVMTEYFNYGASEKVFSEGESLNFSILSFNYPLGLLDNISLMVYYDWKNKDWYRFISWNRTYDKLSFYMIGFWNPDEFQIYNNQRDNTFFTGTGFQIMLVYNH